MRYLPPNLSFLNSRNQNISEYSKAWVLWKEGDERRLAIRTTAAACRYGLLLHTIRFSFDTHYPQRKYKQRISKAANVSLNWFLAIPIRSNRNFCRFPARFHVSSRSKIQYQSQETTHTLVVTIHHIYIYIYHRVEIYIYFIYKRKSRKGQS